MVVQFQHSRKENIVPVDPVLPHSLDDEYGPGAERAEMESAYDEELADLEDAIADELESAIENLSVIGNAVGQIQPPTSVVGLAAEAAAKVLLAFERGYRMDEG
jgi:hypothetical protein